MPTPVKVALLTLAVAIPAFVAGPILWPPHPGNPTPSPAQLPLFLLLSVLEVLTLGLGVSFIAFALPHLRRAGGAPALTWAVYLSIAWLMVSWWPHDRMHVANGLELGGLLVIEYAYHVTLMVAGAVLGYGFYTWMRSAERRAGAGEAR